MFEWDFLISLADVLNLIVLTGTLVALILYARDTNAIKRSAERQAEISTALFEAQTRPVVLVYAEQNNYLLDLAIENVGRSEARNLRFSLIGELERFPHQRVSGAAFLSKGFSYLAPGQKWTAVLANLTRKPEGGEWPTATFSVTYTDNLGRNQYSGEFPIALSEHRGLGIRVDPVYKIEKHLEAIRRIAETQVTRLVDRFAPYVPVDELNNPD